MATKRKRPPMPPLQRLAVGFLGVVVFLAIGALLLTIARVDVRITPRPEPVAVDFDLTIIGSGKPSEREVFGRLVRVEGTAEASPVRADAPAVVRGAPALTVTLVSTQPAPQPLVATTRIIAPEGVQYRLVKGVTIPARGRVEDVAVVYDTAFAQPAGADMAVGAPRKYTIPGLSAWLRERVWAESAGPMQVVGERASEPIVPAAGDVVRRRAMDDAAQRAAALAKSGEESFTIASTSEVTETATATRAVATITAILIPKGAVEERARAALEAVAASSGRTLARVRVDALRTRLVSQARALARATIAVHAEGDATIRTGSFAFEPRRIVGFTPDEVRTYLRSLPGVADVEVQLRPFWVKRVPASAGSVQVEVREAE